MANVNSGFKALKISGRETRRTGRSSNTSFTTARGCYKLPEAEGPSGSTRGKTARTQPDPVDTMSDAQLMFKAACINFANGLFKKAINAFKMVLELDQNFTEAYFQLGLAYHKNKEYKNAITSYEQAIKIYEKKMKENPTDKELEELKLECSRAYYDCGRAYDDLGDPVNAAKNCYKAAELSPEYVKGRDGTPVDYALIALKNKKRPAKK